uniref:MULE transposase domain-containing protein n=1 Tax=Plectus sambesii TaxID=2011161 RepID=A0A914WHL2_9BILA
MPRFKKNWRLVDKFNCFEDLKKVLEEKKVHKRSSKKQKYGEKVEYECKQKRQFKCPFEMFTYVGDGEGEMYELYEYEAHNCETAEYKRSLKRAAREMIDMAMEVRRGVGDISPLAQQLAFAREGPGLVAAPTPKQMYNAVAYKKRKLEGPPIRTIGALFEEISSRFPEGSAASPPDSVIRARLDCDPDNPNAFYTFLTTQRLLQNLGKPGGDVLQVDGTYKLMYEENTVLTLGVSDRHRRLHPVGITIIGQTESTTAYVKLFECLKEALRQSGLPEYRPSAVMSDGDPSITRAVSKVFSTALCLTCFFHMKKQVKVQMMNKGVPKERRSKILKEISLLQLSPTVPVFLLAAKKLLKQWRTEGMTRFSHYFRRIWI